MEKGLDKLSTKYSSGWRPFLKKRKDRIFRNLVRDVGRITGERPSAVWQTQDDVMEYLILADAGRVRIDLQYHPSQEIEGMKLPPAMEGKLSYTMDHSSSSEEEFEELSLRLGSRVRGLKFRLEI